jgi:succinyl-CoA synthetase beta subunit
VKQNPTFTANSSQNMNIHEYQGKAILKSFGVRVQEGIVADSVEQAVEAAKKMKEDYGSDWVVVKAQIHAGGRGKGGGVKLAKNLDNWLPRKPAPKASWLAKFW